VLVRLSGCTGRQMGEGGAQKGQRIIHFSLEKGMIISWERVVSYLGESYQQLGE
jgi:hypothetical protein